MESPSKICWLCIQWCRSDENSQEVYPHSNVDKQRKQWVFLLVIWDYFKEQHLEGFGGFNEIRPFVRRSWDSNAQRHLPATEQQS